MIGPTAFATLVWGSVALVLALFAYEAYLIALRPLLDRFDG